MNDDELIHVVLAVYDPSGTYSQHAGVTITSIFENTKSKIIIHLLHDETLTDDNRKKFIHTAEKYHQTIEFIDVTEHTGLMSDKIVKITEKWTVGALYRLFIPGLMPEISKVIYLDCDIVVNLDIKNLWDINIDNYCFAAMHDPCFEELSETVRDWLNRCSSKTFVNSGVMIMNLDMIRRNGDLFNLSVDWTERRVHLMLFSDQDIINSLFYGSIKLIDPKFNNCNPLTEQALADSIIHTPVKDEASKIWSMSHLPPQKLYWKMYLRSAWGEDKTPEDIADILYNVSSRPEFHRESYLQCLFRVFVAPFRRLFWYNPVSLSIRYILKDIYYRLKYKFTH